MTTVCIHQPDFVPHMGFFHRLLIADKFILLDDVQFIRRGWQHRDQIKGRNGPTWLTLSLKKGDYHQRVNEVLLSDDQRWIDDNLHLLQESYTAAPFFKQFYPRVEAIYRAGHKRLIDLNMAFLHLTLDYFQIQIPMVYSSEYAIQSSSSERLLKLVNAVNGDIYLTGTGSKDYLDVGLLENSGIAVNWQVFKHPIYPQLHGAFSPGMSCLDIIFNCGEASADILRSAAVE